MKIKNLLATLIILSVVLMSGCKKSEYKGTVGVCPLVVSTIPANGAAGVPLNQVVSATFNEKMNSATITKSSFILTASTTVAGITTKTEVDGAVSYSGMTAFFTSTVLLTPNTTYTGRVKSSVRDIAGNALQTDYVWTFSTDVPPTVSTNPANGAVDVLLNKNVVATFSVTMDSLTLKSPLSTYTIKQGSTDVPGKFSYTGNTATFTPTGTLAPFTVYTGKITTGAKNMLGTPMAADYIWSFTTIPQLTLSSNPILGGTTSGAGTFAQGSSVTVVATPATGFSFINWTEGVNIVSTSASYQFAMAGNKTLVANFTIIPYTVAVSSNPTIGGITSGGGTFNSGATVAVTAVPNGGYTFTNWTEAGTVVSTTAAYTFILIGNRTLVANYTAIPYTVAVSSNPIAGGITSGGGTFNSGATVALTAVANSGYTFTNWTENGTIVSTTAAYTFIIIGNRTLVANYTSIQYTVAVSSNPVIGGITSGGGSFNSGATVSLTAVANSGYTFTNWTENGTIVSTTAAYTFIIIGNRTLVANYTAIQFTVAVSSSPVIGGITSGGGTFNSGATVALTAVANSGYTFTNWTEGGTIVSTNAAYTFIIIGNRTFVANYTLIPATQFTVAVSSSPVIGGITSGGGTFNSGATVALTAVANSGYTFTNWTEGGTIVSTNAAYTFIIIGNRTLVANYTLIPATQFTVSLSSNPSIGGTTTGAGSFNAGTSVAVTSLANSGYTFTNWTEGLVVVSSSANYIFTISGNRTLVANFAVVPPSQFAVNLLSNPVLGGTTSGAGSFNSGASVTVNAIVNSGYTFTNWTEGGTVVSSSAGYTFTIGGNRTLVANFTAIPATQFAVSLSSNPLLGGTTTGAGSFVSGSSVAVTALANIGYTFTNWTEGVNIVSTSANYIFVISGNRTLVANFTEVPPSQFAVNLSSNPPLGGTTTGGGSFNSGVSVSVTATPNVGYTFTNWTESGTIVSAVAGYTFNITGNRVLVANFSVITYTLGVTAINGSVLKNPNQPTYNSGSDVVLTATPNSGYTFTSWSGDATGSVNPLTVTMNSNKNVTANFTAIASTYTLNVIANNGSVLKNPDLLAYNSGASVLLTATPNSGYTFTSWSGDATGSVNPLTVIMNSNKNITANFTLSPPIGPGIVDLGTAGNYVTLTKSGISTTGVTSITGDIAVSPMAATGITGFGLIMDTNGQSSHTTIVTGKVYAADYAAPTPANLTTAVSDMETAFTTANNLVVPAPIVGLYSGNISGRILPAGLYKWSTGVLITNAGVTLTGGANDTWVFQIAQNLTVDNSAIITLLGGAQAKNIFWVVTGEATLGSNVNFSGNILSKTLISLNTGASVTGRLLAQTAVTLNANTVIMP